MDPHKARQLLFLGGEKLMAGGRKPSSNPSTQSSGWGWNSHVASLSPFLHQPKGMNEKFSPQPCLEWCSPLLTSLPQAGLPVLLTVSLMAFSTCCVPENVCGRQVQLIFGNCFLGGKHSLGLAGCTFSPSVGSVTVLGRTR